jgi:Ethanolamine utilization protein EutJ (predicted chaperonin)
MGENGIPLSGAIIVLAGTTLGTSVDKDGNFTLSTDQKTGDLVVSYVGYETKKIIF